jgi:DNA-binding transcriptional ArsR family regulator
MTPDRLSQAFSALSDSTRRAILARLASGDASVNELVEPFHLSQPAISKHLKVLENAGLISRGRVAQSRPCHLEVQPLKEVADWIEHYRHFWTGTFDRLDTYLQHMQAKPNKG